jgi:hypothetical protein
MKKRLCSSARGASLYTKHASNAIVRVVLLDANSYLALFRDKNVIIIVILRCLQMYIKCGAVASAIRVAAEASAWKLVWRAGSVSATHALHAASILENAEQTEHAIALYQKAGEYKKYSETLV